MWNAELRGGSTQGVVPRAQMKLVAPDGSIVGVIPGGPVAASGRQKVAEIPCPSLLVRADCKRTSSNSSPAAATEDDNDEELLFPPVEAADAALPAASAAGGDAAALPREKGEDGKVEEGAVVRTRPEAEKERMK